jgi:hypothetical protein
MMAIFFPISAAAHAAVSAPAASSTPASHHDARISGKSCEFWTANLHSSYIEHETDRGLDWWARGGAKSGNPVVLDPVSNSSLLDCFHVEAYGHNMLQWQLAHSALCLDIAGASKSEGARVILHVCTNQISEMFYLYPIDGQGIQFQSARSGLCITPSAGDSDGSILVQEPCGGRQNIVQGFYIVT